MDTTTWAREEFGAAELGDKRRTKRLIRMAQGLAERPGGKMTRVYEDPAELEAAYRLYENDDVSVDEMERTRGEACARRLARNGFSIIPIDQTSITLKEHRRTDKFGSVGTRELGARGVQVMTALGLDTEGVVLGVLVQERWVRSNIPSPLRKFAVRRLDPRPAEERESFVWVRVLQMCEERLRCARDVRPWYQVDQGADYWRVFDWARTHDALLTARICHERVVVRHGQRSRLHPWIAGQPVAYHYDVELPERSGKMPRAARTAHLSVRFGTATFQFVPYPHQHQRVAVTLSVVAVTEPRPPRGAKPINWLLVTTFAVRNEADAELVIKNYALRWRDEEFHRTLKTGACDIEASELESFEAFSRLLVISSSVAARIERIKFLSRTQPDAPATVAYSKEEIDMTLRLRQLHRSSSTPTYSVTRVPLHLMTRWVAILGGYRSSQDRGPPGTIVLSRGLKILETAVLGARAARSPPKKCG